MAAVAKAAAAARRRRRRRRGSLVVLRVCKYYMREGIPAADGDGHGPLLYSTLT